MLTLLEAETSRPAEALGEEAGAALSIGESPAAIGEPNPMHARWLRLTLPAADLAPGAEERAAAMIAAAVGERHLAMPLRL